MVKAGHEGEQPIFVDTTENLQAFVEKWAETYEESEIKMPVPLRNKSAILTSAFFHQRRKLFKYSWFVLTYQLDNETEYQLAAVDP